MFIYRNIEVCSFNHCCSVKTIGVAYSESESVALDTQHGRLVSRQQNYHSVCT
jgi:hypothetical protein